MEAILVALITGGLSLLGVVITNTVSFGMAGVAAITVICYLAATAVKQTPLANKWLPTICGTLGGVLGVLAWCGSVPDFPAGDPLTALAVGIVSGLAATGTNQLIRQLKQPE